MDFSALCGPYPFSSLLERLRSSQAQRFVIVFRNRPQAVLVHVAEYERLVRAADANEQRAA
jgi:PHD/YefM family antitoxin component YafN of YafNO toxin-antitoxin module